MNWVQQAARLPVAFAVVREDPRIDLEVLRHLPPRPDVVMIASGGETALRLASEPLASLLLVDFNPAQLELVRRKWLLSQGDRHQALLVLGHSPGERSILLGGLEDGRLGPFDFVCDRGLDYLGRYEAVFQDLREHGDFQRSFSLTNLVTLFGEGATRNPRHSFADHFAERTAQARRRPDAAANPFLHQIIAGRFPPNISWDWLDAETWNQPRITPHFRQGEMHAVLRTLPNESADFVHLSNILDWLDPEAGSALLRESARVLRSGGITLIRQLNSSLDIPALPCPLTWDHERGQRLVAQDRSYFYPQIHWGRRA